MQFIKIFMLFMIFLASSLVGKTVAGKYKNRLIELKEFKNALNIFKTKIKFTYEPIPEIFDEITQNSSKNVGKAFALARENLKTETAGEAWKDAILNSETNLKEEDKATLTMLSKLLGESDVEGQVSQIDITLNFLDKQIEEAEDEKTKNEKLYKKLGTIMGLALVIILI